MNCKDVASIDLEEEPSTVESLKWPENVKIFHPDQNIEEIKKMIEESSDTIEEYTTGNPPEVKETYTSKKHFSSKHYALLFAPGEYKNCDFEVGYYVQMAGLGASAMDVTFTGTKSGPFVDSLNKNLKKTEGGTIDWEGSGLALDTFWRAAENFSSTASDGLMWSVSQAAPLRRVSVTGGDLKLVDSGYASGGFLANAFVGKQVRFGGQQQFFTRNVTFEGNHPDEEKHWDPNNKKMLTSNTVDGVAWSSVLSGCDLSNCKPKGQPENGINSNNKSTTIIGAPAVRVEKPFIVLNGNKWELHVPKPIFEGESLIGSMLDSNEESSDIRDFKLVKVVAPRHEEKDDNDVVKYNTLDDMDEQKTNELQAALNQGKDLILCPGQYFLTKALEVINEGQVVLGLGLATLIAPQDGSPCIRVKANCDDVRIACIQFEASVQKEEPQDSSPSSSTKNVDGVRSLVEVGSPDVEDEGNAKKPIVLSDVFCRVGGSNLNRNVSTNVMVRIHTGNVVGDNLWLWRADHVRLGKDENANDNNFPLYYQIRDMNQCKVETALEVRGNNVKMYGLFCEHTTENQMIWKGNNGTTLFFQCELPYDATSNYADKEYAGYVVHESVENHTAKGVGVYSNFTVNNVNAARGISHPQNKPGVTVEHPYTIFLSNKGGIDKVINDEGPKVPRMSGDPEKQTKMARV